MQFQFTLNVLWLFLTLFAKIVLSWKNHQTCILNEKNLISKYSRKRVSIKTPLFIYPEVKSNQL